jgi:hypothetical protein
MNAMDDQWVAIRSFMWLHEAQFLRSVLEAAGIESVIPNEYTIGVQPFYANMLGGVHVLVHAEDVDRATEVLDSTAVPDDPLE